VQLEAPLARLGQFQWPLGCWHFAFLDVAEEALGQSADLIGGHVADHHQGSVVRRVPLLVPGAQLVGLHAVEVGHPADGRVAIAAGGVGDGLEALVGQRTRLVIGAQAALFLDHFDLAGELVWRQLEAGQAIGFELERNGQAVTCQDLVIGGVVVAGEGVFLGAQLTQDARGFAGIELAAALEHHVFERVGEAGLASRLVAGANLVPELGYHYRRTMILAHDHFQAVVEEELVGGLAVCCCQQGQIERSEQQGGGAA